MGSVALAHVLRPLQEVFRAGDFPDLLVGLSDPDDAAVLRRSDDEAIVVTADFFPPVVDDPSDYGAIAAANAMSDVFAMGGEVLLALNLAAFPEDMDHETIERIIRGGAEQVRAAGGVVAGGHTVIDAEPKFGMAVVGRVHPRAILRKGGAVPGDVLLLTKPIGTGIVTTALKAGMATESDVSAAVSSMRTLNRAAGRVAVQQHAHAATDVTGFALVGHAMEMASASGACMVIRLQDVPLLPGTIAYAVAGHVPSGTGRNMAAYCAAVVVDGPLSDTDEAVAYDPQTSGGLLIAAARADAARMAELLREDGMPMWEIGEVTSGEGVRITNTRTGR
jgi:selenide,water dikinase